MRTMRPADIVAQMGCDELAALLANCSSELDARAVATNIQAAFKELFRVDGVAVHLAVSIGWATSDGSDVIAAALLAEADTAMNEVKRWRASSTMVAQSDTGSGDDHDAGERLELLVG